MGLSNWLHSLLIWLGLVNRPGYEVPLAPPPPPAKSEPRWDYPHLLAEIRRERALRPVYDIPTTAEDEKMLADLENTDWSKFVVTPVYAEPTPDGPKVIDIAPLVYQLNSVESFS